MKLEQHTSQQLDVPSAQNGYRSDDQLMAAVVEGESEALEQLYDRHVQHCFGLAIRIVEETSVAEDVVQEVFIKLWSRPGTFSPERGSFKTWLLMVVRNQALDVLRRAKARAEIYIAPLYAESTASATSETILELLPDGGRTPHEQAWANETATVVRRALGQLPAAEYQAIALAYFGGLSQQEVANELHLPLGTVKTRTRSALRRMHTLLVAQGALAD